MVFNSITLKAIETRPSVLVFLGKVPKRVTTSLVFIGDK